MKLKKIFSTGTFRQSILTLSATIINGILGAVFYILTARALGPVDFGLLTISITVLTLVADIGDLGTNTGLIKFVAKYLKSDPLRAYRIAKLSLIIKVLMYLFTLIVGILIAPGLAASVFNKPELTQPLRLAFVGVGGAMLFSLTTALFQSFERFVFWSSLNIAMNGLRVVLIGGLLVLSWMNIYSALWVYILMPFLGFAIGMLFLPFTKILKAKDLNSVGSEFYHFNRWVALFVLIAAFSSRLDTFLAGRFLRLDELGVYGAGNQLASTMSQLVAALGVVVAPKFASFDSKDKMLSYFKKSLALVLGLALVILVLLPLSIWILPLIYGTAYAGILPIFVTLIISGLIFLISVPVHNSLIYYYGRSDIFVWVAIGHLLVVGLAGWILVNIWGAVGLATAVTLGTMFNLLIPTIWWWRLIKK